MKYFGKKNYKTNPLYWQIRDRNFGVYSEKEQIRIKESRICVVGLGCVGELEAVMLARIGVGELTIIDYDELEISNLNRNPYSQMHLLNKPKAENMARYIEGIDPTIRINAINDRVTFENADKYLKKHQIIIQAVDDMFVRIIVHRVAERLRIPCITMSGGPPFRAFVTVIMPGKMGYEEFLDLPIIGENDDMIISDEIATKVKELKKERVVESMKEGADKDWGELYLQDKRKIWAVTPQRPYITAVLSVQEAIKYILGKRIIVAPEYYSIDLNRIECPVKLMNKQKQHFDFTSY